MSMPVVQPGSLIPPHAGMIGSYFSDFGTRGRKGADLAPSIIFVATWLCTSHSLNYETGYGTLFHRYTDYSFTKNQACAFNDSRTPAAAPEY